MEARDPIAGAIAAWERATEQLVQLVRGIEPAHWAVPASYPGWTNKDLLAHLATGYAVRTASLTAILDTGGPGDPPDADAANAARIAERKDTPVDTLIVEMIATRRAVRDLMARLRPEHLEVEIGEPGARRRLGDALPLMSGRDLDHAHDLRRPAAGSRDTVPDERPRP